MNCIPSKETTEQSLVPGTLFRSAVNVKQGSRYRCCSFERESQRPRFAGNDSEGRPGAPDSRENPTKRPLGREEGLEREDGVPGRPAAASSSAVRQNGGTKWSGPVSRVLSGTAIYLLRTLPCASSAQPGCTAGHRIASLFAFAPDGACQATQLPACWCALTAPFQLFPHEAGVFFSVTLSVGSPRPAVSWHPALWSPDFPRARRPAAVEPAPGAIIQNGRIFERMRPQLS